MFSGWADILRFRWQSVVDFMALASALYLLLRWGRETRALRTFLGVAALRGGAFVAHEFDLAVTAWLLETTSFLALVLLLVVFQPEIRRAFTNFDFLERLLRRPAALEAPRHDAVVKAAFDLAAARRGALIVMARRDSVAERVRGGVPLGGEVSAEILEAIFRKVSPVHDGAAVIEGGRIARVAAVLPLSDRDLPSRYGTRHRAAMGLSERCDALVIAVSEERGTVTVFQNGNEREMSTPAGLHDELARLVNPPRSGAHRWPALTGNLGLKAAALALAAAIWTLLSFSARTTIRTIAAPIELLNVPTGLRVADQSAGVIQVRVRGRSWFVDRVGGGRVTARFDLRDGREGANLLVVQEAAMDLPPGLTLEGTSPDRLAVELRGAPGPSRQSAR